MYNNYVLNICGVLYIPAVYISSLGTIQSVPLEQKGKRLCYPDSLGGTIAPGNKQVSSGSDERNFSPSVLGGKCV